MKKLAKISIITICSFVALLTGCASPTNALLDSENQVKLRQIQSRRFDTNDKKKTLRTAMATLQDLGFVIDDADDILGSVSATKLNRYQLRMTVTVRPYGEEQMVVRASAQYNVQAVEFSCQPILIIPCGLSTAVIAFKIRFCII